MTKRKNANEQMKSWMDGISKMELSLNEKKYKVEDEAIQRQIEYAESLAERPFSNWEKQIFEWAYIQGREDFREGKTK